MRSLKNWLDEYMNLVVDTENPVNYNKWCGIAALSSALKRNVYVWFQEVQYFPNQYIILVGPPGLGKGRAMKPAIKILDEAKAANILYDRATAEKIIEDLAIGWKVPVVTQSGAVFRDEHVATIIAKELPNFLGASDWMHSLLCQFWDENRFDHATKNKGVNKITELCVSLLGGCVPDYIRGLTKDRMAAITGGFTSRSIFVYATKKAQHKSRGWGAPSTNNTQLEQFLIADLGHIRSLGGAGKAGEMTLTKEAMDYFDSRYTEWNTYDEFESEALINFKSRVPSHIIKTAITLSISDSDQLVITKAHLEAASLLVEEIRDNVDITFRAVGESPLAVAQDRVMRFIQNRGVCSRTEILRYNSRHITDEQLTSVLKVLVMINFCTESYKGSTCIYTHNRNKPVGGTP